jgi:hypothetical protein
MANVTRMKSRHRSLADSIVAGGTGKTDGYASRPKRGKFTVSEYPPITEVEVIFLRQLMDDEGSIQVAEWMEVAEQTALRVAAGLGHKCRPDTMGNVRKFFAQADLGSLRKAGSALQRGSMTNGAKRAATK